MRFPEICYMCNYFNPTWINGIVFIRFILFKTFTRLLAKYFIFITLGKKVVKFLSGSFRYLFYKFCKHTKIGIYIYILRNHALSLTVSLNLKTAIKKTKLKVI